MPLSFISIDNRPMGSCRSSGGREKQNIYYPSTRLAHLHHIPPPPPKYQTGYNLGIPLNPADLRDFEAFSPTGPWLFPRPCLWGPDEVGGWVGGCVARCERRPRLVA